MSGEAVDAIQTFRLDIGAETVQVDQRPAFEYHLQRNREDHAAVNTLQETGVAQAADSQLRQDTDVVVEREKEKAAEQAFEFVRNGDISRAKALIEHYKLNVNAPEHISKSSLENGPQDSTKFDILMHVATVKGDEDFVQYLIEKAADKGSVNEDGLTPIHVAILNGNVPVARFFLSRRTKTAELCRSASDRCTLLQLAMASASRSMMEMVLNDATVHDVLMCWQQMSSAEDRSILETKRGFFPPENGTTLSKHAAAEGKKAERLVQEHSQAEMTIIKNQERAMNRKRDIMQMRRRTKKHEWRTKVERQELQERMHCEAQVLKIDKRKKRKAKGGGSRAGGKGVKGAAKGNPGEERRRVDQGRKKEQSRRGEEQGRMRIVEEAHRKLEAGPTRKVEDTHPKPHENQWTIRENSAAYLTEVMECKRQEAELREKLSQIRNATKKPELPQPSPQPSKAGKKASKKSKRNPEARRLRAEEQERRNSAEENLSPARKSNLVGLKGPGFRPFGTPLVAIPDEAKTRLPKSKSRHKANPNPEVARDNAPRRRKKEKQARANVVADFWA